jgi:hypothetical protein
MAAERMAPTGFAMPRPAMSGAEPCTGSNIDGWRRVGSRLALGARPRPPVTVAVISERMSPKRLEATITSKLQGRRISSMAAASTRIDAVSISGNSAATSRKTRSQKVMLWPWALDFVIEVTARRFCVRASSKAKRMMRSVPRRVKTAVCTATSVSVPPCTCPPTWAYSPSVFSRTRTMSIAFFVSARGVATPGKRTVGRTFAYCSKVRRMGSRRPLSVVWSGTRGWPTAPR